MKQRLIFIDVIRAYAICMMLQGHFITALLGEPYWDESNITFILGIILQVSQLLFFSLYQALSSPTYLYEKASAVV